MKTTIYYYTGTSYNNVFTVDFGAWARIEYEKQKKLKNEDYTLIKWCGKELAKRLGHQNGMITKIVVG